jgi:hypothetical protein
VPSEAIARKIEREVRQRKGAVGRAGLLERWNLDRFLIFDQKDQIFSITARESLFIIGKVLPSLQRNEFNGLEGLR